MEDRGKLTEAARKAKSVAFLNYLGQRAGQEKRIRWSSSGGRQHEAVPSATLDSRGARVTRQDTPSRGESSNHLKVNPRRFVRHVNA